RPESCPEPSFEIDEFLEILTQTLNNFHSTAETSVTKHLDRLGSHSARTWISDGQQYLPDENCPFCGQDIRELDLIKQYQRVFNEGYNALRELLAAQEDSAAVLFRGCDPEAFQTNVSTNKEKVEVWKQTGVTTRSPVAT